MRSLADEWKEKYDMRFAEVARALYLRATDIEHPQGVQAARLLAELLDMFPNRKTKGSGELFGWLASLVLPPTGPDGR